jgi:hypothetical protein
MHKDWRDIWFYWLLATTSNLRGFLSFQNDRERVRQAMVKRAFQIVS